MAAAGARAPSWALQRLGVGCVIGSGSGTGSESYCDFDSESQSDSESDSLSHHMLAGWAGAGWAGARLAASEPGPNTPPPAKRSKRTKVDLAAEPTHPIKVEPAAELSKGKAAKAKPAPQPGRWLDRDCNATLNMQRIEESRWRPLELCWRPKQTALLAKGKEYPGLGYKRLQDKPPKAQQQQQQPAGAHTSISLHQRRQPPAHGISQGLYAGKRVPVDGVLYPRYSSVEELLSPSSTRGAATGILQSAAAVQPSEAKQRKRQPDPPTHDNNVSSQLPQPAAATLQPLTAASNGTQQPGNYAAAQPASKSAPLDNSPEAVAARQV
ncbi:hypothetical protein QJQ45_019653 [Haematococcus lacustris]|nr:hypothetical protein QJQ45_019653 [Haematococcus lacustris]